jgi:hypothetical protein
MVHPCLRRRGSTQVSDALASMHRNAYQWNLTEGGGEDEKVGGSEGAASEGATSDGKESNGAGGNSGNDAGA